MDVDEVSNLKIQIYESRSKTTESKARGTVSLIANDGKLECIVYDGDSKSTRPGYEEAKDLYPFELIQAFEKCITAALVPPGSSSGQ